MFIHHNLRHFRGQIYGAIIKTALLTAALSHAGCDDRDPRHPSMNGNKSYKTEREIIVATRNAPTSYYIDKDGESAGFEYELASAFITDIGHTPKFIVYDTVEDIFNAIREGKAHFAAAGLTRTFDRLVEFPFSQEYLAVEQQVICDKHLKIEELSDLIGRNIIFTAASSYEEYFFRKKLDYPALDWISSSEFSTEQLLQQVNDGRFDCTVADETIFRSNRHLVEKLSEKFVLDRGQLAWPFNSAYMGLVKEANLWFRDEHRSELVKQLYEKYFGAADHHDFYDMYIFKKRIKSRLPEYEGIIREAAALTDLEFPFLASVAYQESHWNPKNRSPTGVRGFMMLTIPTAKSLGVTNRLDAKQSMMAGARYLKGLIDRFPGYLREEDRRWLGLASYNIGYYHVEDARRLAIDLKKNPNSWKDIKTILPLLANKKYHSRARYGYARGREPVIYVRNIRNYQKVLEEELSTVATTTESH